MTILQCWNCGKPVDSAADEFCAPCRVALSRNTPLPRGKTMPTFNPPQPATGYQKNVTPPPGPNVRYEDCFPESCCEGAPLDE